jgi:hypothetical protein
MLLPLPFTSPSHRGYHHSELTSTPPPSRSRTAGFESKRVDGFECQTSGEAVFELFWSEEALNNVNE